MNTSVECFDLYKDRDSCGNVILNICCVRFVASFLLYIIVAYSDEKRRLLSILACEYPYRVLKQYFQCSNNTNVAARVHCLLFGRGGVSPVTI